MARTSVVNAVVKNCVKRLQTGGCLLVLSLHLVTNRAPILVQNHNLCLAQMDNRYHCCQVQEQSVLKAEALEVISVY